MHGKQNVKFISGCLLNWETSNNKSST